MRSTYLRADDHKVLRQASTTKQISRLLLSWPSRHHRENTGNKREINTKKACQKSASGNPTNPRRPPPTPPHQNRRPPDQNVTKARDDNPRTRPKNGISSQFPFATKIRKFRPGVRADKRSDKTQNGPIFCSIEAPLALPPPCNLVKTAPLSLHGGARYC